jgi:cytosine/adenosine deaminase-related metal-dependent hydrolase
VNRRTPSGQVIGPAERVSPYLALKAVTAHAAWQTREEKTKGTLEVGKLADLVILERNPLTVDPTTIKDIAVLETIKEGRTIFRRDADGAQAAVPGGSSLPCLHAHGHGAEPGLSASAHNTLQLLISGARLQEPPRELHGQHH